jgi:single-strand DNA-binding protein
MQSTVTLVGNVVTDVTLRQTSAGPVAGFRLAATHGYTDRRTQQWVERTAYLHVSAWRALGEHVAGSVHKGQPVVVVGRLRQRDYEKDGQRFNVIEVDADLVGHDLSRGTAEFVRARRGPQTADLARESVTATELSGDGDTRRTVGTDGTGWAVPGLSVVTADEVTAQPAGHPAA